MLDEETTTIAQRAAELQEIRAAWACKSHPEIAVGCAVRTG